MKNKHFQIKNYVKYSLVYDSIKRNDKKSIIYIKIFIHVPYTFIQ